MTGSDVQSVVEGETDADGRETGRSDELGRAGLSLFREGWVSEDEQEREGRESPPRALAGWQVAAAVMLARPPKVPPPPGIIAAAFQTRFSRRSHFATFLHSELSIQPSLPSS